MQVFLIFTKIVSKILSNSKLSETVCKIEGNFMQNQAKFYVKLEEILFKIKRNFMY